MLNNLLTIVSIIGGLLVIFGAIIGVVWRLANLATKVEYIEEAQKNLTKRISSGEEKQNEDTKTTNGQFSRLYDKIEVIYQIMIKNFSSSYREA